jgi:hypothetical protein
VLGGEGRGGLSGVSALLAAAAEGEEGVEMGGAIEVEKTAWFAFVDDDSGEVCTCCSALMGGRGLFVCAVCVCVCVCVCSTDIYAFVYPSHTHTALIIIFGIISKKKS